MQHDIRRSQADHRLIQRIEVLYQTEGRPVDRPAKMQVFGLKDAGTGGTPGPIPSPGVGWETLGTRSVGFIVDHDTVLVGASHGRFRRIMLKVQDHDIYMYNLRVRFANGETQELPVNSYIRAGTSTGVLDLNGDQRTIDRVDMVYRTKPGFYHEAKVTVLGRH